MIQPNRYKTILIILLLIIFPPTLLKSKSGDLGIIPMLSVTWDTNIGFNYSGGIALGVWGKGIFNGAYGALAYSKQGHNLSFGTYTGVGIATLRIGVNYMNIYKYNDTYWGLETSPSMILGHLRMGIMRNRNNSELKINFAPGIGLF